MLLITLGVRSHWVQLMAMQYDSQEWGWNSMWKPGKMAFVVCLLILVRRLRPKLEQLMGRRPLHGFLEFCMATPNPMA